MENKELTPETCDGDSCEGCAGCITSTIASSEATITADADADDEDNTPVGARNYEQQIDSYMAYLASGGLGKLYKKDAAKDDPYYSPNGYSRHRGGPPGQRRCRYPTTGQRCGMHRRNLHRP